MTRTIIYAVLGVLLGIRGGYVLMNRSGEGSDAYQTGGTVAGIFFILFGLAFLRGAIKHYREHSGEQPAKADKLPADDLLKDIPEGIGHFRYQKEESKEVKSKQNYLTLD